MDQVSYLKQNNIILTPKQHMRYFLNKGLLIDLNHLQYLKQNKIPILINTKRSFLNEGLLINIDFVECLNENE
jgi:hypothetical protein